MLSRRMLLLGAAAAAVIPAAPAFAGADPLLSDILRGVTDALVRDYIRGRYQEGRWDGSRWWHDGKSYSPEAYGRYWADDYKKRKPAHSNEPKHSQQKPQEPLRQKPEVHRQGPENDRQKLHQQEPRRLEPGRSDPPRRQSGQQRPPQDEYRNDRPSGDQGRPPRDDRGLR